jgi:hypothetical protein
VVSFVEDNLVVFFTISVHLKSGQLREVAFGGSDLIRGGLLYILVGRNQRLNFKKPEPKLEKRK